MRFDRPFNCFCRSIRSFGTKQREKKNSFGFATQAIHAGYSPFDCNYRPVVPPIIPSSTFEHTQVDVPGGPRYSRLGNPSRSILEKTIATLEEAKYGLCFSSGMAAVFAVTHLLSPGDHVICSEALYGGTIKQMQDYVSQKGLEVSFVHPMTAENVKNSLKENTKLVFIESPANPLLDVADIKKISAITHKHSEALLTVDNTFMTPYFQKPLTIGADIVMHSLTKYMNGHGDVVMGSLVTNRTDVYEKLNDILCSIGLVPSAFDCFLVNRGLQTLNLRMEEHARNAMIVAEFLEKHPLIERVIYPGLLSHPQHELAKTQCKGFGGMVSFYIHGGKKEVETILGNLKLITHTGSLGQPTSLISYPRNVSHYYMTEASRKRVGITENFVRLSVGLENVEDIIDDLSQAFEGVQIKYSLKRINILSIK